ncbi:pirin family protein [Undibacterium cyanobacteriorum]|uniref:Pirin family protein n=1 Tax=Undibacterium cyanobacteriorum TaxID=3073561 RepID=A0ABY9RF11_9BURK|nr:pirin family protein [Undibacterium sp. 20NA77.5]WMW79808.1 pirin family protein [Undibacterium sp. 20NA77.5]
MIVLRKSNERGQANHGWLQSRFSFSFAEYYDPRHMGFGPLRVINDDWIAEGMGFGMHPHKDMEIITYVLEGEIAHKDSMGNGSTIRPGDVQRMSAGTGVRHSEFNPSSQNKTHLLQIWIMPDRLNLTPSYEEKRFTAEEKRGRLRLVASPDAREGSVRIHQQASLYVGLFDEQEEARYELARDRLCYVHVARGQLTVNQHQLEAGDALLMQAENAVQLSAGQQAEVLLFDLPY